MATTRGNARLDFFVNKDFTLSKSCICTIGCINTVQLAIIFFGIKIKIFHEFLYLISLHSVICKITLDRTSEEDDLLKYYGIIFVEI